MKTTFYLIRHGETAFNKELRYQGLQDIPLNATGKKQAALLGKKFKKMSKFDFIFSSTLSRAIETAEIINKFLNLGEIATFATLVERDYGVVSGMKKDEAHTKWPDRNFPEMESRKSAINRLLKTLKKIAAKHPGKRIIIASHGSIIRSTLAHLLKGEINSDDFDLKNGTYSILALNKNKWEVEAFNKLP